MVARGARGTRDFSKNEDSGEGKGIENEVFRSDHGEAFTHPLGGNCSVISLPKGRHSFGLSTFGTGRGLRNFSKNEDSGLHNKKKRSWGFGYRFGEGFTHPLGGDLPRDLEKYTVRGSKRAPCLKNM